MLTAGSLTNSREFSVTISRETLVLVAIALLALSTRFAELSVSPLQARELPAAVAAIHAPAALPVDTTGVSPILRIAHRLLFSLFGAETDSLRLPVALAGVALVLSPQLFRPLLGRAQSLALSGLLLISPLLLFASRSAESAILAQLAIISMLYAIYQCWLNRNDEESKARHRWQIASAFTLALTVFLTDGRGYLLAGSAILAAFYAIGGGVRLSDESRVLLRDWPWRQSLLVILASLLLLSTALLTQLDGLALVGDNLAAALVGWASPGNFLQIIGVSFYYEHGYWLLAAFALISRWKRGEIPFPERFAAAWFVLLTLALTLDRGTNPAHASLVEHPARHMCARCAETFIHENKRHQRHNTIAWRPPSRLAGWNTLRATFRLAGRAIANPHRAYGHILHTGRFLFWNLQPEFLSGYLDCLAFSGWVIYVTCPISRRTDLHRKEHRQASHRRHRGMLLIGRRLQ